MKVDSPEISGADTPQGPDVNADKSIWKIQRCGHLPLGSVLLLKQVRNASGTGEDLNTQRYILPHFGLF